MGAVRSFLFNICFYTFTLLIVFSAVPLSLIFGKAAVRWVFRTWSKTTVFLAKWVLGAKVEIRGREHIGPDTALVVSKHQSELDIALLGTVFPNYGAIAMRELDKYPVVGRLITQLGHIKVTVDGPRQNQLPEVIEGTRRVHAEGRPILIFPEGTLMEAGRKMRYRAGVWHIYNDLGVPATPVALSLSLAWPQRQWRKYPAECAMEFLEPIPPGLGKQEFMQLLEDRIEIGSNALIREQASPERLEQITFDHELDGDEWSSDRKAADAAE